MNSRIKAFRAFPVVLFCFLHLTNSRAEDVDFPIWGTYRPQALISARAAVPHSPFFGFAYHPAHNLDIRHLAADHHDKIKTFSWSRHDPYTFGDQTIEDIDANLRVTSHFMNHPSQANACVIRVSAVPLDPNKLVAPTSLVFYAAAGPDEFERSERVPWGFMKIDEHTSDYVNIRGRSPAVGGDYQIRIDKPSIGTIDSASVSIPIEQSSSDFVGQGSRSRIRKRSEKPSDTEIDLDRFRVASFPVPKEKVWGIEKILRELLHHSRSSAFESTESKFQLLDEANIPEAPGIFVQRVVEAPFSMEASFVLTEGRTKKEVTELENDLSEENLSEKLKHARKNFDTKFENLFRLREKNIPAEQIDFAKSALSNLLGGIGFFYGSSIMKNNAATSEPEVLPSVGLLTATPSRALFPRGFLWDEGFHQLLIQRWNPGLSKRCLESWFRASQKSGWIPREQILGIEARSRFPQHVQHLVMQDPLVANPPTILMPLRVFAKNLEKFNSCSNKDSSSNDNCVYNKKLLQEFISEALPQATKYYSWLKTEQAGKIPGSFRWQGRSPESKSPDGYPLTLASGLDDYPRGEVASPDERHVDLHSWITWASETLAYISRAADEQETKYMEEHKELKKSLVKFHTSRNETHTEREDHLLCDYDGEERICHEGYVTILPLVLGLLSHDDPRVDAILESLENPNLLRGNAGIRSLSKQSEWHRKGDDYWTGSVWIPFNFLTLAALRTKYSIEDGPYRKRAEQIYNDLKNTILTNTFKEFKRTGQLWENYSPDDEARGKSGRQFTGWSSLVVLLYADMFDGVI